MRDFRGYEDWQVVAVSHNGDKLATILGNPTLIEAYRAGIPGNGKPFPDGARFAKIHWTAKKDETSPASRLVPGALHDVDFMVKDSKKFADSGGWGYAQFEYDSATEAFRPGDDRQHRRRRSTTPNAGSPATRSWRIRITCSRPIRSGEALSEQSLPDAKSNTMMKKQSLADDDAGGGSGRARRLGVGGAGQIHGASAWRSRVLGVQLATKTGSSSPSLTTVEKLDAVFGNPVMIEAYKAGVPGSGKPVPDGAMIAKIHWMAKKAEDQPRRADRAGRVA